MAREQCEGGKIDCVEDTSVQFTTRRTRGQGKSARGESGGRPLSSSDDICSEARRHTASSLPATSFRRIVIFLECDLGNTIRSVCLNVQMLSIYDAGRLTIESRLLGVLGRLCTASHSALCFYLDGVREHHHLNRYSSAVEVVTKHNTDAEKEALIDYYCVRVL